MPNINRKFDMSKIDLTEKPIKKRHAKRNIIIILSIAMLINLLGITYLVNAFFDTHTLAFQTPVILQAPVLVEKKLDLLSPVGSSSANILIHKAYAEEVKNPFNEKSPKGIAWKINSERFGVGHWASLNELLTNESGWNPYAKNGSSGACGIGQAMPCEKMDCEQWDYECQVNWALDYIEDRYETPTKAYAHWLARVPVNGKDVGNWY